MAVYHLRTFRLGQQATAGTAVARTAILQGVTDGSVSVEIDDSIVEAIGWNVGNLVVPSFRHVNGSWTQVATYEQILYALHGLFGPVTPTGSAAPYTWTYKVPAANAVSPRIYTLEYAVDTTAYVIPDCLISSLTIRGEVNKAVETEVEFISPATNVTVPAPTSLTPPTGLSVIRVRDMQAFIGPTSAAPTSELIATLIAFEITVAPNRHVKRFIGGTVGFGDGQWEISGSMTLEYNAASQGIINPVVTGTALTRWLRLEATASDDQNKSLIIDTTMLINDSVELFRDRDGNVTVEVSFTGLYTSALASALQIAVKNNLNTLT